MEEMQYINVTIQVGEYAIVMDIHGHLQWQSNEGDGHPLLCILSENVSEEHLQKQNINYS